MELGLTIKKMIATSGYSQNEVARKIGVSPNTVSRWTNGKNEPKYRQFVKLLDLCGLTIVRKEG